MITARTILLGILSVGLIGLFICPAAAEPVQPDRVNVTLHLKREDFTVYRYVPGEAKFAEHPLAVIIFGSGDGGFDGWEDRVSRALQSSGYEVLGFDCALYAKTDYDLDTLQVDTNTIAQSSLAHYANHPPPLILGGWSMGAEQAVPAAGGPHPPIGLEGLLLISPGDRGRYGLREADRYDVTPTGPGTFALQDFAHSLNKLRVVQWDGNLDLLGSKTWLESLTAPHKAYDFPWGMHDYNGASDQFLKLLKESITWLLSSDEPGTKIQSKNKG
jgi:phosphatidylglycerol lysyltransferase